MDGLRLDAINFCFHDAQLRDNPGAGRPDGSNPTVSAGNPYAWQRHLYDRSRPDALGFLQRLRQLTDRYPRRAMVGEIGDESGMTMVAQYSSGGDKLHMGYCFDLLTDRCHAPYLRSIVERFETVAGDGWACWALSNHDCKRLATRWGGAHPPIGLLKLAPALQLSLRGSSCIYQGDELGLPEVDIAFEDLRDPYGITMWPEFKGRDGCRTPFPWDSTRPDLGFGSAAGGAQPVAADRRGAPGTGGGPPGRRPGFGARHLPPPAALAPPPSGPDRGRSAAAARACPGAGLRAPPRRRAPAVRLQRQRPAGRRWPCPPACTSPKCSTTAAPPGPCRTPTASSSSPGACCSPAWPDPPSHETAMSRIDFKNVCKRYAPGLPFTINNANLTIERGEFCVFVGPSGCGKSTLLRMVAGLEDITSGDLSIGGKRYERPAAGQARRGDGVPELRPVPAHDGGREHGLRPAGDGLGQGRDRHQGQEARPRSCSSAPCSSGCPRQLSGGQRQRVAIGRAIVKEPDVFLFDEPLSNLDAALRVQTRLEIAKLHHDIGKASMIYVTHDQVEAMTLADKIVLLRAGAAVQEHGSVAQFGSPMELYHRPQNLFVAEFIGSPKMNILPGRLVRAEESHAVVDIRGEQVTVAVDAPCGAAAGSEVSLGIRPEHLLAGETGEGSPVHTTLHQMERPGRHLAALPARHARRPAGDPAPGGPRPPVRQRQGDPAPAPRAMPPVRRQGQRLPPHRQPADLR